MAGGRRCCHPYRESTIRPLASSRSAEGSGTPAVFALKVNVPDSSVSSCKLQLLFDQKMESSSFGVTALLAVRKRAELLVGVSRPHALQKTVDVRDGIVMFQAVSLFPSLVNVPVRPFVKV